MKRKNEAHDKPKETKKVEEVKKKKASLADLVSQAAVVKTQIANLKASEETLVAEIKAIMQEKGLNEITEGEFIAKLSESAKFDKASLLEYVKGLPAKVSKSILVDAVDEKLLEEAVYRGDVKPIDLEPYQVKGTILRISKVKAAKK